jgi:hypothetical protein
MQHAGRSNGELIVTYGQFELYGVPRKAIAGAIREAVAMGFILVADRGAGGNREFRRASTYALAWLPTPKEMLPRRRWAKFMTIEEAREVAATARSQRSQKQNFAPRKGAETTPLQGGTRLAG